MSTAVTIGMGLAELSGTERQLFCKQGLKVTNAEFWRSKGTNINQDFIITRVNGVPVESMGHFRELIKGKDYIRISGIYKDGTHDHYFIECSRL